MLKLNATARATLARSTALRGVTRCEMASWLLTSALVVAVGLPSARAQSARAQSDTAQNPRGGQMSEIVVTAQKRTTSLQAAPISLTAVSGADLVRKGVINVAAIAASTPGVSMTSEGPGRSNYDIRGMSNIGGTSATVGFYLDEVPVTPPTSALSAAGKAEVDPDLYDLARVEVLRGPQGTLYGGSSMGGTIRLITNQPKLNKLEASGESIVSGTEGGGINYTQNAMVNVPVLKDTLAVRITATEKHDSGFIDRIVVSPFPAYTGSVGQNRGNLLNAPVIHDYKNVNDAQTQSVRVAALWQPIEHLSITPSFYTQRLTQNGQDTIDIPPGTMAHYQPADVPERFMQAFQLYSVTGKYDFDSLSLQSTTSQFNGNMFNQEDTQEQWYGLTQGFSSQPYFPTPGSAEEDHRQSQLSEEFRVSTNGDGKLQGIAGAYYSDYRDRLHYNEFDSGLTSLYGTNSVFTDNEPDELKQAAFFADVTYAITDKLKADAGLRYFDYTFTYAQHIGGIVAGAPFDASGSASASGVTPKFNLSYEPTRNLTLFATAAEGFRPGGPNLPVPAAYCSSQLGAIGLAAAPTAVAPDSVWSYELGEKARLFDNLLSVRSSAYYIDWSQIQQQIQLSCGYNFNANAGHAYSEGGEVEFDVRPSPYVTLHGNLGYTKAELTSTQYAAALPVGQQLQDVPRYTFGVAMDVNYPITDSVSGTFHLDDNYVDRVNDLNAQPYPVTDRPAYNMVNLRTGIDLGRLQGYVFVDNLLNRRAILGYDHSEAQNTEQFARAIPSTPLTIGLDLQYHY